MRPPKWEMLVRLTMLAALTSGCQHRAIVSNLTHHNIYAEIEPLTYVSLPLQLSSEAYTPGSDVRSC